MSSCSSCLVAVAVRQGQRVWPRACRSDICTNNALWKKTALTGKRAAEPGSGCSVAFKVASCVSVCLCSPPADMGNHGQARPLCGETWGIEETQSPTRLQLPAPTELASLEDPCAHLPSSVCLCQGNCSGLKCPGLRTTIVVSSSSVKGTK